MKKKFVFVAAAAVCSMLFTVFASAALKVVDGVVNIDEITVTDKNINKDFVDDKSDENTDSEVKIEIDGTRLETDQPAVIVNDRTMIPVRAVAEAIGVDVEWNTETKTASFGKGEVKAYVTIGSDIVNVDVLGVSTEVEIDSPAVIISERTMVPLRVVSEVFGNKVEWDAETRTVIITTANAGKTTESMTEAADNTEETTEALTEALTEASTEETTIAAEEETTKKASKGRG